MTEFRREVHPTEDFPYPFSLDVVSLYTAIPVDEAIRNVADRVGSTINHFSRDDITEMLTVITGNVYFTFEAGIYLQTRGLPMGSSVSGILAILFMDTLERKTLTSCTYISEYDRYVDDAYLQTTDEEHADQFLDFMNQQHQHIKFEIEKPTRTPDGYSLSLLDFNVTIQNDGRANLTSTRRKPKSPSLYTINHGFLWPPRGTSF